MPETAGNFLDVDAFVCEERCVRMPEIVNADMRQIRGGSIGFIFIINRAIAQDRVPAGDAVIIRISGIRLLAMLLIAQCRQKRVRDLQITIGAFIFRRSFHVAAMQFLRNAATHMKDIPIDIRPP